MVKAGVYGTGVYVIAQSQLLNTAQALKIRMLDYIKYQLVRYGNKAIHRVVEYFAFVNWAAKKTHIGGKWKLKMLVSGMKTKKPTAFQRQAFAKRGEKS